MVSDDFDVGIPALADRAMPNSPSGRDYLGEHIRSMTAEELRDAYDMIRGNPKTSSRRIFSEAELLALKDLSDELERRKHLDRTGGAVGEGLREHWNVVYPTD